MNIQNLIFLLAPVFIITSSYDVFSDDSSDSEDEQEVIDKSPKKIKKDKKTENILSNEFHSNLNSLQLHSRLMSHSSSSHPEMINPLIILNKRKNSSEILPDLIQDKKVANKSEYSRSILERLPNDLIGLISEYLKPADFRSLLSTCHFFHSKWSLVKSVDLKNTFIKPDYFKIMFQNCTDLKLVKIFNIRFIESKKDSRSIFSDTKSDSNLRDNVSHVFFNYFQTAKMDKLKELNLEIPIENQDIEILLNILKSGKLISLESLSLGSKLHQPEILLKEKGFSLASSSLPNLITLCIFYPLSVHEINELIIAINKNNIPKLNKLRITIQSDVNKNLILDLLKALSKLNNFSHLDLKVYFLQNQNENWIFPLKEAIHEGFLIKLKILMLEFASVIEQDISDLTETFVSSKNLIPDLKVLKLSNAGINNNGFKELTKAFDKGIFPNLSHLDLSNNSGSDVSLRNFIIVIGDKLTNINSLNFSSNSFGNESLMALTELISQGKLSNIESLIFKNRIYNYSIISKFYDQLALGRLSKLKNLQTHSTNMNFPEILNAFLKAVWGGHLNKLEIINFYNEFWKDPNLIENLLQAIQNDHLPNLRAFNFLMSPQKCSVDKYLLLVKKFLDLVDKSKLRNLRTIHLKLSNRNDFFTKFITQLLLGKMPYLDSIIIEKVIEDNIDYDKWLKDIRLDESHNRNFPLMHIPFSVIIL